MVDTLGLKHFFPILPCEKFKDRWRYLSRKKFPTWVYNHNGKETLPNLTIYQTPDKIYHFETQVSVPKMLFGHNARLPNQDEADFGSEFMANFAEEMSGLPFDAETANVFLIHYAHDEQLTEPKVWEMIEKLAKRRLKGWRKRFEEDATLYFNLLSQTKRLRIYPKLQKVLSEANAMFEAIQCADGKLRFENCLLKKSAIDSLVNRLQLSDSTAKNLLTEGVSNFVMSELLDELNFYELLTTDKSELEMLREIYKPKKSANLRGFLQMLNEFGEDFWRDVRHGYTKDCYDRLFRECGKAKLP